MWGLPRPDSEERKLAYALGAIAEARGEAIRAIDQHFGDRMRFADEVERRHDFARKLIAGVGYNETMISRLHAWVEKGEWPKAGPLVVPGPHMEVTGGGSHPAPELRGAARIRANKQKNRTR